MATILQSYSGTLPNEADVTIQTLVCTCDEDPEPHYYVAVMQVHRVHQLEVANHIAQGYMHVFDHANISGWTDTVDKSETFDDSPEP